MATTAAPYELIIDLSTEAPTTAAVAATEERKPSYFKATGGDPQVVNDEQRIIRFIGTTTDEDRYGDVVESKGAVLDNYVKNPVFLWGHNHNEPAIGKCVRLKVTDTSIIFDIQFADTVKALEIYKLYKGKYMRAVSIGFIPLEDPETRDSDSPYARQGGGYLFKRWELLELSAVTIPANPNALSNDFKTQLRAYLSGFMPKAADAGTSTEANVDISAALDALWADSKAPAETKPAQDEEAGEKDPIPVGNTTVPVDGVNDEEKKLMESMTAEMAKMYGLIQGLTSALNDKGLAVSVQGSLPHAKHALVPVAASWNGAGARSRCASYFAKTVAAGNMTRWALAFAYVTPGKESQAADYKFLHHDIVAGKLSTNFKGVANAMAQVLTSTLETPARKAAYNHLAAHYKEFGKVPPAFKTYGAEDLVQALQDCMNPKSIKPVAKGPSATSDREPYEDGDGPSDSDPYPEDANDKPATDPDKTPGQEDKAIDGEALSGHLCKVMKSLKMVGDCMKDFHTSTLGYEPPSGDGEEDKAEDDPDADSDADVSPDEDAPAEADTKPEDKQVDPDAPVDPNAKV